jgi:putative acyl-CoA dehydrogenase
MTPVVKYWVCKTAPGFIYEAMECLGGNGYVEEGVLARLYREAPVNAIWEGSGNVMCLDVMRALSRAGEEVRAALGMLVAACANRGPAAAAAKNIAELLSAADGEMHARAAVESLASLAAAAALAESGSESVAAAFASARLEGGRGRLYGAARLAPAEVGILMDRAMPE